MMKLKARKAKGFVFKSFCTARFIKLTFHVKNGYILTYSSTYNTYITILTLQYLQYLHYLHYSSKLPTEYSPETIAGANVLAQ